MMNRRNRPEIWPQPWKDMTLKCLVAFLALSLVPFAAIAQAPSSITPEQAIARVLGPGPIQSVWFDPAFLAQVPIAQVQQVVDQYTSQSGKFQRIDKSDDGYTVFLERASFPAKAALNPRGQFTMLWFGNAQPLHAVPLEDSIKPFSQLPGKVALVVEADGTVRASLNPDQPLAVGSAFKLAIINALKAEIAAKKHHWDQVVFLNPAWKSLPSGVIRTWPDQTPLTLATLANEMISISDNTAADALLSIAGRDNVEAVSPRNRPFLSTREAFTLKDPANAGLLARYRAADPAGRRALLPAIDKLPLPDVAIFASGKPVATDIEWFFTPLELCTLIDGVRDLGAMQINPGVATKKDWQQIAYKGGSEPGVLNLTTALTAKNGRLYCASATWNNDASLEDSKFFTLYGGVLSSLAAEVANE
jgi:beta-lactamase class A